MQDQRFSGIHRKIEGQRAALSEAGLELDLVGPCGDSVRICTAAGETVDVPIPRAMPTRIAVAKSALEFAIAEKSRFTYTRFQFFDPSIAYLLRRLKHRSVVNVLEIPTYPYAGELRLQGFRGSLKGLVDRSFSRATARSLDRIVTFSDHESILNVQTIRTSNGLDFPSISLAGYRLGSTISLICVSSMFEWHGYDRLLNGMLDYYKSGGSREIFLHMVGDGKERSRYEAIAVNPLITSRVKFHGVLDGEALDAVFDQASIGVSSLALHRIGVASASTLKSREYAARGLALVGVQAGDVMSDESPYALQVPSGEAPIDLERVIAFHDRIAVSDFRESQRLKVLQRFDFRATMRPVANFLTKATDLVP